QPTVRGWGGQTAARPPHSGPVGCTKKCTRFLGACSPCNSQSVFSEQLLARGRTRMGALPDWALDAVKDCPPLLTKLEWAELRRSSLKTAQRDVSTGRVRAVRATEGGSSRTLIPRLEAARALARMAGEEVA